LPHIIVKMHAGRDDLQKQRLADEIARVVLTTLGSPEAAISVAIEDVAPADWIQRVYGPDIEAKPETLFRKPGYGRS
jgi:4-oxalocrotonate tautomerase